MGSTEKRQNTRPCRRNDGCPEPSPEAGDLDRIMGTLGEMTRAHRMRRVTRETGLGEKSSYKSMRAGASPSSTPCSGCCKPWASGSKSTPRTRTASRTPGPQHGLMVLGSQIGILLSASEPNYAIEVNANMVRLALVGAVLIAACLSCFGGPEVVRMGTEGAYPPYSFINDEGKSTGSSVSWATSYAGGLISNARGLPTNGTPSYPTSWRASTTPSWQE